MSPAVLPGRAASRTDLARAARSHGLNAVSEHREADDVLEGPFPVIVQWNVDQFLVVEGVSGSKAYLNDPGTGPREVPAGSSATVSKACHWRSRSATTFTRGAPSRALVAKLGRRLKGLSGTIGFIAWISLMLVLPGLIVPGMTAVFVDNILIRQFEGWLGPMLVGLGATVLINIALRWLQGVSLLRLELRLALEQSAKFAWHVFRLPIAFFTQRFTGDLASRVEANDRVATLLARDFGNTAAGCLTAGFLGAVMIFYDTILSAIVLGGAALNIVGLQLLFVAPWRTSRSACKPRQGKLFRLPR